MRRLGLTALMSLAVWGAAVAAPFTTFEKDVPRNTPTKINGFYNANLKCVSDRVKIVIKRQPLHGKVEIKYANDYPNYPKVDSYYACNKVKVLITQVWYVPAADFVGKDAVSLFIAYSGGFKKDELIALNVH